MSNANPEVGIQTGFYISSLHHDAMLDDLFVVNDRELRHVYDIPTRDLQNNQKLQKYEKVLPRIVDSMINNALQGEEV